MVGKNGRNNPRAQSDALNCLYCPTNQPEYVLCTMIARKCLLCLLDKQLLAYNNGLSSEGSIKEQRKQTPEV